MAEGCVWPRRQQVAVGTADLALTLVVGDAFSLGGVGLLGGQDEYDHRDQIGKHLIDVFLGLHAAEGGQEGNGRAVGADDLEEGKEQRRAQNGQRFPVAEDHDGQGEEAVAADGGGEGGAGHEDVGEAADAGEEAGDHDAGIAHLVDVDAHGVRRLGMLAAGPQPQAEAGVVEDDPGNQEEDDGQGNGDVEFLEQRGQEVLVDLAGDAQGFGGEAGPGGNGDVGDALALDCLL